MCSPKFKPGPPTEEAQVLSERLNQALITSNFLPFSTLCIHPGKAAWVLYVDATCINYDGNALDATLLAMVAALRNTNPTANDVQPRDTTHHLLVRWIPNSFTAGEERACWDVFGIFDNKHVLADPTSFEEALLETSISVVLGDDGELVSVEQLGSALVTLTREEAKRDVLDECIQNASQRGELVMREVFR